MILPSLLILSPRMVTGVGAEPLRPSVFQGTEQPCPDQARRRSVGRPGHVWAEDHHDVELMDAAGRVLARKRLPEGVAGMAQLHELTGQQLGEDAEDAEVVIGIGTDRGPWVAALVAAFADLDAPDALELLARAPDPARAAKLTRAQVSAALKRARRRDIPGTAPGR